MMSLEILVSTMNQKTKKDIETLQKKMNIKCSSLIINQCPNETKDKLLIYNNKVCKVISYPEKGLSKSRNCAIKQSTSDICVIADDDLCYEDDFEKKVISSYEKYPDADIIAFYVESSNKDRPTTMQKDGKKSYIGSMKISSFQITFKRKSIINNNLYFDERFGAGSGIYKAGEENIFLFDCLKKKLKIYYVSEKIATVNHQESTWFSGFDKQYLSTLGAAYYRMTPLFSNLLIIQFLIRKYKLYKNNISFLNAFKYMKKGKKKISFRTFFVGDFLTSTGPAIVNANIKKSVGNRGLYSNAKNNLFRVFECFFKTLVSDCVFFCSFSKLDIIGIKFAKFFNKPTFYLMHGRISKENMLNGISNLKIEKEEKYLLDNINYIFCVSKQLYEEISLEGFKEKADYIFNGIDYKKIIINSNVKKDKNIIMSTGGLMPRKNNIIICEAIKKINKNYNKNIKYLILGEDYGNLELIKKYNFVKFYSSMKQEECLKYMKKSFLYIQNSCYETFGLAAIEALVNDCNLLISKNIGSKDIIKTINNDDIIFDINDVNEIANKILKVFEKPNCLRLQEGLDKIETSIEHRGKELLEKIGEKLYE